jgi:hypothetical protein
LHAWQEVLKYCESERLIPRESVMKKRLMDAQLGFEFDFEELAQIGSLAGISWIEGQVPQRIMWPINHTGEKIKFACADFFQPTQRLKQEQILLLLEFLNKERPEIDRGRYAKQTILIAANKQLKHPIIF